jgi:hypothetical protein
MADRKEAPFLFIRDDNAKRFNSFPLQAVPRVIVLHNMTRHWAQLRCVGRYAGSWNDVRLSVKIASFHNCHITSMWPVHFLAAQFTKNVYLSSGVFFWVYSELLETRWLGRYHLKLGYLN